MSRVLLTLVFVVDRSPPPERAARRVLLGLKKRGFGADKWNGFGGKVELSDASIEAAAARGTPWWWLPLGVCWPSPDVDRFFLLGDEP